MNNELYIFDDRIICTREHRRVVMMFIKVLCRLGAIDEGLALNIAVKFRVLFV
jgi:hypothetical protein